MIYVSLRWTRTCIKTQRPASCLRGSGTEWQEALALAGPKSWPRAHFLHNISNCVKTIHSTNKRCCLCVYVQSWKCLFFLFFLNVCFQVAGHFRAASCRRRTCFSWFLLVARAVIMGTARCSTVTCAHWAAPLTKAASVVQQSVSKALNSKNLKKK